MIDKYRLDDLRLESGEKGELARWVIQLQTDLDRERRKVGYSPAIPDGLIAAVNRLLDSDGSRGCYSAISCYDAHKEIEHLLAAAPPAPKQENI
ncbi:hypothetical protein LB424_02920 [Klebsiella pneumoniae]|uniref:hypothetical protein n=1 Tax=Klebsiella pneumoniae TaxID=573 RepID=UPI001E50C9B6|nr:hypothetical protein [Klebsiella pneumoniae]MCD5639557.1 hypothetical protein [Klebsiella pneumoniae]